MTGRSAKTKGLDMRWQLIAFIALLPIASTQVADAQDAPTPTCEVACRVNPFTAPASCDCNGTGSETPVNSVPQTEPAPPVEVQPAVPIQAPPPAEPGVPSCEVSCRVNPFTAPAGCDCNAPTGNGGGSGGPVPGASRSPAPVGTPVTGGGDPAPSLQSWSAQPGETVRNSFGPMGSDCRGACGPGCASTCGSGARYECLDSNRLQRFETYECGTHPGCRIHDDCLDRCHQANAQGVDCEATCHVEAFKGYGAENALSWVQGGGPYDGVTLFEYTRSAPGAPEPFYRCVEGTRRECGGGAARCLTAAGVEVEPVFDSFPPAGLGTITLSEFRSGRLCEQGPGGSAVCEETIDIQVTGTDSCAQGAGSAECTQFGLEFDYRGANPAVPLVCSASSRGGSGDLAGTLVAQALSPVASQDSDLGAVVGGLQEALRSGQSLDEILSGVSVAPLDDNGRPVESARVGASPAPAAAPATPTRVTFEAASGHLVVPMYELHDRSRSGEVVVREVECSYNGAPVLETRFRLRYAD